MDFFETNFFNAKKRLPDHLEVVVCVYVSNDLDAFCDFYYGIPVTFAYYDHEYEKWVDLSYQDGHHYDLNFRDKNNNVSGGVGEVEYWIDKTHLSGLLEKMYQNYQKEMREKSEKE